MGSSCFTGAEFYYPEKMRRNGGWKMEKSVSGNKVIACFQGLGKLFLSVRSSVLNQLLLFVLKEKVIFAFNIFVVVCVKFLNEKAWLLC